MKELLIFSVLILFGSLPAGIILAKVIFKKSVLFTLTVFIGGVVAASTILTYITAVFGFIHMLWTTPLIVGVVVLLIVNFKKKMDIITGNVNAFASGTLNLSIDERLLRRKDELGEIARSLSEINSRQERDINNIKQNVKMLSQTVELLKHESGKLIDRTQTQDQKVELLNEQLQQLSDSVQTASQSAGKTVDSSNIALKKLDEIKEAFLKTYEHVNEISKKTIVLNDIAFQTDILSLNAAIESSKAGKAGKGFSVVAQEVNKLSEKSNREAKAIQQLSKSGADISERAGNLLQENLPELENSLKALSEILSLNTDYLKSTANLQTAIQKIAELSRENIKTADAFNSQARKLSIATDTITGMLKDYSV